MKILLVEDDDLLADFIKRYLSENGYQVDAVDDGSRGATYGARYKYSLIILDMILPGMLGIDICKELREKGVHTPILFLSSEASESTKIDCLRAGADDYLTKPFNYAELLARVEAILRRPETIVASTLEISDLHIDISAKTVRRNQKLIDLTPKEYELLETLAINHPNVMNRTKLLRQIWGIHDKTNSGRLDVCASQLRSKVDKAFSNKPPIIRTIRGVGYALQAEGKLEPKH